MRDWLGFRRRYLGLVLLVCWKVGTRLFGSFRISFNTSLISVFTDLFLWEILSDFGCLLLEFFGRKFLQVVIEKVVIFTVTLPRFCPAVVFIFAGVVCCDTHSS